MYINSNAEIEKEEREFPMLDQLLAKDSTQGSSTLLLLNSYTHLHISHTKISFLDLTIYIKQSQLHTRLYTLSHEISFLDLTIYIKQSQLHTKLYTKTTDWHMYLNYFSEHPTSLKKCIPYSQFLRLKRIHSEPHYLLEAQIHIICFSFGGNTPMTSY